MRPILGRILLNLGVCYPLVGAVRIFLLLISLNSAMPNKLDSRRVTVLGSGTTAISCHSTFIESDESHENCIPTMSFIVPNPAEERVSGVKVLDVPIPAVEPTKVFATLSSLS